MLKPEKLKWVIPVAAVTISCAAISILLLPLRPYLDKSAWGLVYTLFVVVTANRWGIASGVSTAVVSFFCWNFFFLPPYGTLQLANPADWLSLSIFLVVAVVIGLQTGHVQQQQRLLTRQVQQTKLLNRIGSQLVSDSSITQVAQLVTHEIQNLASLRFCHLYWVSPDGSVVNVSRQTDDGSQTASALVDESLKTAKATIVNYSFVPRLTTSTGTVFKTAPPELDAFRHEIAIPLASKERLLGALHLGPRKDERELTSEELELISGLANLTTSFFEREALKMEAVAVESLREADNLKQTFISAISHELKTPVSAIHAVVSNLARDDIEWSPEVVREELSAMSVSLDRLSRSISSLLDYSRLETANWKAATEIWQVGEILSYLVDSLTPAQRGRLKINVADNLPEIRVDFSQLVRAISLVVENALNYSPAESEVIISVKETPLSIDLGIADQGPGISQSEREHVFDKFYRGNAGRSVTSGTGLGLTIAQQILQIHQGHIEITDNRPVGTIIHLILPRARQSV